MPFHWPGFDSLQKLSAEETAELAARMADLTRAGLPLGDGLRALCDELPGRRLRRVLRALADQLDAGVDLTVAVESQAARLPTCLCGLVLAGLRSGRLAETLEEYVDLERSQSELRRRLWLGLAYPFTLLMLLTVFMVIGKACCADCADMVVAMARNYASWGFSPRTGGSWLPMTRLLMHSFGPTMWAMIVLSIMSAAILLSLRLAPSVRWAWALLRAMPLIGPLMRWSDLAQFARVMGLLLEQQTPLPDALRLSAAGLHDGELALECRAVAGDVEHGRVLYESMAARPPFPASMIPLIEWGQRTPALADSFRAAAEMFEGRMDSQDGMLRTVLPPMLFLLLLAFALAYAAATVLPAIVLMRSLLYFWW